MQDMRLQGLAARGAQPTLPRAQPLCLFLLLAAECTGQGLCSRGQGRASRPRGELGVGQGSGKDRGGWGLLRRGGGQRAEALLAHEGHCIAWCHLDVQLQPRTEQSPLLLATTSGSHR